MDNEEIGKALTECSKQIRNAMPGYDFFVIVFKMSDSAAGVHFSTNRTSEDVLPLLRSFARAVELDRERKK